MSEVGTVDYWKSKFEEESKIVDRCWLALGVTTYAGANGKSIYELISALRAKAEATAVPEGVQPTAAQEEVRNTILAERDKGAALIDRNQK